MTPHDVTFQPASLSIGSENRPVSVSVSASASRRLSRRLPVRVRLTEAHSIQVKTKIEARMTRARKLWPRLSMRMATARKSLSRLKHRSTTWRPLYA